MAVHAESRAVQFVERRLGVVLFAPPGVDAPPPEMSDATPSPRPYPELATRGERRGGVALDGDGDGERISSRASRNSEDDDAAEVVGGRTFARTSSRRFAHAIDAASASSAATSSPASASVMTAARAGELQYGGERFINNHPVDR